MWTKERETSEVMADEVQSRPVQKQQEEGWSVPVEETSSWDSVQMEKRRSMWRSCRAMKVGTCRGRNAGNVADDLPR